MRSAAQEHRARCSAAWQSRGVVAGKGGAGGEAVGRERWRTGDMDETGKLATAESMLSSAESAAAATCLRLADAAIAQRAVPASMRGTTLSVESQEAGVSALRATCEHSTLDAMEASGIMSASPGHGSACRAGGGRRERGPAQPGAVWGDMGMRWCMDVGLEGATGQGQVM